MLLWLIVLFPLIGATLNGLILPRTNKTLSHVVGVASVGLSFIGSLYLFLQLMQGTTNSAVFFGFHWIDAGPLAIPFELVVDHLSALMLLVVTGVGTLIHIYAGGYMHHEDATYRFFAYLNLFVFMMLLLVLGNNMLVMFVGWEGVGLCSYLLIGYWFQEEANARAGMKAFIVNRIGDIGFLIGMFLTYRTLGTLSFSDIRDIVGGGAIPKAFLEAVPWITLCLFVGACGKSAQLPLYVWLPDAMAGPTPVSALIHAATMVTAGIYMMTRLNFVFYLAPSTMLVIACVGAATALFAATIALVQTDIKKVLAYSTVSQLGYMVMACGVGAFDAGVFHLLTHACFKALLFMGAGSVIVAMHHKQDMMEMGGLKKYMPITHAVFLIAVLAIIGFPGLAGFFSKDEILAKVFSLPTVGPFLWLVGVFTAGCTSFYMVRLLCLTFYGPNRSDHHTREHLHETSWVMWAPLTVLAFLSVVVGYLGIPHFIGEVFGVHNFFEHYMSPVLHIPERMAEQWSYLHEEANPSLEWGLMTASVAVVFVSAGTAIRFYAGGPNAEVQALKKRFARAHNLLTNKYWVDELYAKYIVHPLHEMSEFLWRIVDIRVINEGLINGIGNTIMNLGGLTSFRMTGSIQRHAALVMLGIVGFMVVFVF